LLFIGIWIREATMEMIGRGMDMIRIKISLMMWTIWMRIILRWRRSTLIKMDSKLHILQISMGIEESSKVSIQERIMQGLIS
jgi:hypothetical protein